jgi:hypothetical protein
VCTSVIPVLRRWRQEDGEFLASLGYITRPCIQKKKERKRKGKRMKETG